MARSHRGRSLPTRSCPENKYRFRASENKRADELKCSSALLFSELKLLLCGGRSLTGKNLLAILCGDSGLTDVGRCRILRRIAGNGDRLANLQSIFSPSLPEQRVRRSAFDSINMHFSAGILGFNLRVDVGTSPFDRLYLSGKGYRLCGIELGRHRMVPKYRRCRHQHASPKDDG